MRGHPGTPYDPRCPICAQEQKLVFERSSSDSRSQLYNHNQSMAETSSRSNYVPSWSGNASNTRPSKTNPSTSPEKDEQASKPGSPRLNLFIGDPNVDGKSKLSFRHGSLNLQFN